MPVYSSANDTSIIDRLELYFSELLESARNDSNNVNAMWLKFKNTVHACIQLFVPFKLRKTIASNPWIARNVIHLKRKINRLKKQKKKRNTDNIVMKSSS